MRTDDTARSLARLFGELVDGVSGRGGFALNTGDIGLLRSLDALQAAEASRSVNGGATIAAHAQHVRYGLSLMTRWAAAGGNPFANAKWGRGPHRRVDANHPDVEFPDAHTARPIGYAILSGRSTS